MKNKIVFPFFIAFSLLYVLLIFFNQETITWYFKPLLVPFLFFLVWNYNSFVEKKWLLYGLLFSWIGDLLLMFVDKNELFFITGLFSFLTAHFFYLYLFIKQKKLYKTSKNISFWFAVLLVVAYLGSIMYLLFPKLGSLKIPVTIYAFTISTLLLLGFKVYFGWKNKAAQFVLIGAIAFVLSDSLLAINKFYNPIEKASFWIMSTYIIAQTFIVIGILRLNKK
jgi:uncharacterized membrane protein YhhN